MVATDTLVIRNFPSRLKMRLKIAALEAGIPLNLFVAEALEQALPDGAEPRRAGLSTESQKSGPKGKEPPLAAMPTAPPKMEESEKGDRVPDVPGDRKVRKDAGRVSHAGGDVGGRDVAGGTRRGASVVCKHGRKKGFHCWQCGGLAKVGE